MNQQQQQLLMKLLTNPETAEFFKDKDFIAKLQLLQTNPMQAMQEAKKDPRLAKVFEVLMGEMKGKPGMPGGPGGMPGRPGGMPGGMGGGMPGGMPGGMGGMPG